MAGGQVKVEDKEMMVLGDLVKQLVQIRSHSYLLLAFVLNWVLLLVFRFAVPLVQLQNQSQALKKAAEDLLPVSLLCGFLGASKITLL